MKCIWCSGPAYLVFQLADEGFHFCRAHSSDAWALRKAFDETASGRRRRAMRLDVYLRQGPRYGEVA